VAVSSDANGVPPQYFALPRHSGCRLTRNVLGVVSVTVLRTNGAVQLLDDVLDLSKKNKTALEKLLKPYIEAGTKVTKRSGRTKASTSSRGQSSAVREWAKANGIEVSERGRISKSILDQYDAST
jgi:hypothetical protein